MHYTDLLKYAILVILSKKDALAFLCHMKKDFSRLGLSLKRKEENKVVNTQMYSNDWCCQRKCGRLNYLLFP